MRSLLLKLGACQADRARCSCINHLLVGRGEVTPRRLRVFINSSASSDFNDLEDMKPHLDVALQDGEVGIVEYPLRAPAL